MQPRYMLLELAGHLRDATGLPKSGDLEPIDLKLARYAHSRHRVAPLLYVAITHGGSKAADEAAAWLRSIYQRNSSLLLKTQGGGEASGEMLCRCRYPCRADQRAGSRRAAI